MVLMNDSVILRISKVCRSFEHLNHIVSVLQDVSFEAFQGQSLVMTGPSGSGKSTLLHLIGALDKPSSGEIEIDGTSLLNLSELELAKFRLGARETGAGCDEMLKTCQGGSKMPSGSIPRPSKKFEKF